VISLEACEVGTTNEDEKHQTKLPNRQSQSRKRGGESECVIQTTTLTLFSFLAVAGKDADYLFFFWLSSTRPLADLLRSSCPVSIIDHFRARGALSTPPF